ncbi:MAG: GTP-binding protein, partial [Chthoniobacterales bacterium]
LMLYLISLYCVIWYSPLFFVNHTLPPLRIITVGHVDHGKSTLLGRLLYDTNSLSEEQLAAVQAASQAEGKSLEWAFVLDAFLEEQAENITIDITQIPLRTAERSYIMIDAPGHKEFLKNMLTGASSADAALLLVSIVDGLQEQTRRHVQLLSLLGIYQILVVINKLDLVDFSQEAFEKMAEVIKKLFQEFHLPTPRIIPIAARLGENVVSASSHISWYRGNTLLQSLHALTPQTLLETAPLRFIIQDVYDFEKEPLIVGRVESGSFKVGEELTFWPQSKKNRTSRVNSIEVWGASSPHTKATVGESIAIRLEDLIAIKRGDIASTSKHPPLQSDRLGIRLFWFEATPLCLHQEVILQLATQRVSAHVASIAHVVDAATLTRKKSSQEVHQHEVADVIFQPQHPLVYDFYEELPATGRLAIALPKGLGGVGIASRFGAVEVTS